MLLIITIGTILNLLQPAIVMVGRLITRYIPKAVEEIIKTFDDARSSHDARDFGQPVPPNVYRNPNWKPPTQESTVLDKLRGQQGQRPPEGKFRE
jgi:hypothetical protein